MSDFTEPEIAPTEQRDENPYTKPFTTFEEDLDQMPQNPVAEATQKKYPEYMEQENAKKLYEKEVSNTEVLSPLSFIYYLSQDNSNPSDPRNLDVKNAKEEQGKISGLYASKQKLTPLEWETALQNESGWKEIIAAVDDPDFGIKTVRYLRVHKFVAEVENDVNLAKVLSKTADLIENNIKQVNSNSSSIF